MLKKRIAAVAALIAVAVAALALAACGDDQSTTTADTTDGAFLAEMIPHHETAIEMAKVAQKQADHPEIKQLADDIVAAQDSEIADMNSMHEQMFGGPASADHNTLGMDQSMMGMDTMSMDSLMSARPFDEAFIDEMIPHHQGAIQMARIELGDGQDPEVMDLAQSIIDAQSKEIEQMNEWRKQWYGAESPEGGVPTTDDEATSSHGDMTMGQ